MQYYKPNSLVEVTRDINCIPKGIYKTMEHDENGIWFSIGSKVAFTIIGAQKSDLRLVTNLRDRLRKTPLTDFVERYYELLAISRKQPNRIPTLPITGCMIDPSVAKD